MADVWSIVVPGAGDINNEDYWNGNTTYGGEDNATDRDNKFSTRYFASLSAWAADRDGNSSSGDRECVLVTGSWSTKDNNNFDITAFNADSFLVYCPHTLDDGTDNEARHNGRPGNITTAHEVQFTDRFDCDEDGEWDGIHLKQNGSNADGIEITGTNHYLKNCIFDCNGTGAAGRATDNDATGTFKVQNCIFCATSTGYWAIGPRDNAAATDAVVNCTIDGAGSSNPGSRGFSKMLNCVVFNCSDDIYSVTNITYSQGDDSDFNSGTGNAQWTSGSTDWSMNFQDYANNDYRIKADSSGADLDGQGLGPGDSSTGGDDDVLSEDIAGTARSGVTCAKGAFELDAASSSSSSSSKSSSSSSSSSSSLSSSSSSAIKGDVCWGHDTDVTEPNVRDFDPQWSGTGTITGSGDAEILHFDPNEYLESEEWYVGPSGTVSIILDNYGSNGEHSELLTIEYKEGATRAACIADTWTEYTGGFTGGPWIKIKISRGAT